MAAFIEGSKRGIVSGAGAATEPDAADLPESVR
jgi:hypothetical protein